MKEPEANSWPQEDERVKRQPDGKTERPVVWEGAEAQSSAPDPIILLTSSSS
jgi:hypothetical protein